MATPTLITVHGALAGLAGVLHGTVTFTAHRALTGADTVMPPFTITAAADAGGEFTVILPATNDPAWLPADWAYSVVVHAGGGARGSLQLDYQNASVELADLLQIDGAAEPGVSYVPLNEVGVAGGVAELDDDGDVIDADGNKVAGGGGGAVDSVNGQTGVVVLAASDVGAAATSHTHIASQISDSTTTGRAVLVAADAAAARAAIGAGTSSLALGITGSTAAAGNDSRLSDARTPTGHAASHTDGGSDEISIDGSQVTAGTVAFARLPTGTSSSTVAIGDHTHAGGGGAVDSVNGQTGVVVLAAADVGAAATSHTHTASQISDSTTVGRAVVMAADAAAARTAIGAGTSSLALGTSSSTAAAGDHNHTGTYQPLDSDLTTIAGLAATTDNFMVAAASAWASRTPAQAKTSLSLNNVDNTSDATKNAAAVTLTNKTLTSPAITTPTGIVVGDISGAAPLASPTFTGTPTLPTGTVATTQTAADSTTKVATTAFVTTADNLKANIASPTFTGTPAAPTAAAATSTTQIATTAFVTTADNLKADLASPTFTGTPTLPTGTVGTTQSAADSSTKLATTAFVTTADNLKANLASPTFTGTPAAPTATPGTNTTQVATTAFVTALGALKADLASPTFTGTPTLPTGTVATTQSGGDSSTKIATTAFATGADAVRPVAYYDTAGTYGTVSGARIFIGNTTPTSPADGDIWFDTTGS
jgi:hypothetical protein